MSVVFTFTLTSFYSAVESLVDISSYIRLVSLHVDLEYRHLVGEHALHTLHGGLQR
jgi:hypothetical protein